MTAARPGWHPRARLFATSPVLLQNNRSRRRKDLSISSVVFGQLYLYTGEPPAQIQMGNYHSCGVASVCHYVVGGALPVARCNVEHIATLQRLPEVE